MIRQTILVLLCSFIFVHVDAQEQIRFNKKGECSSNQVQQLIQKRKYQLVSAFDTVSRNPVLVYAIYMKNHKMGILDSYGNEITKPEYDDIPGMNRDYTTTINGFEKYFTVQKNDKYGVINQQGKIIIPCTHEYISITNYKYSGLANEKLANQKEDILFETTVNNEKVIIDVRNTMYKTGEKVMYEELAPAIDDGYTSYTVNRVKDASKKNNYGTIVTDHKNGYQILQKKIGRKRRFGLYNSKSDQLILPVENLKIERTNENNFIVKSKDAKYGAVDSLGTKLLDYEYDGFMNIGTHFLFIKNKKFALYNKQFQQVTDFVYDRYSHGGEGFYVLIKNNKYGLISYDGKELTEFVYDRIKVVNDCNRKENPIIVAELKGYTGLLNKEGTIILPFTYDLVLPECRTKNDVYLSSYSFVSSNTSMGRDNKYYFIKKDRTYGLYDANFNVIVDGYTEIRKSSFPDIVYVASNESGKKRWGLYNTDSKKEVLKPTATNRIRYHRGGYYNFDTYYFGGFYVVENEGKYYLYDETGKEMKGVEEAGYFEVDLIYNGLVEIEAKGKKYFVDYQGNTTKN